MQEGETEQLLRSAATLLQSGERPAAHELLLQVSLSSPDDARVWVGLAMSAAGPDEERGYLEELLRCDPGNAWALAGLARLASAQDPPAAEPADWPEPAASAAPALPPLLQIQAPLPSSDPWADDPPGLYRCPGCAATTPATGRCARCGIRLTRSQPGRRNESSASTFLLLLALVVGRYPWAAIVAFTRLQPGDSLIAPWSLYLAVSSLFTIPLSYGFLRQLRWAWQLGLCFAVVDLFVQLGLLVILLQDWLLVVLNIVFDLLMIGMLLDLYQAVRERELLIDLPADDWRGRPPVSLFNAGVDYSRAKHWYLAARMWQCAVAKDYRQFRYRRALGTAYLWLGLSNLALSELQAAEQLSPDDSQTRALLKLARDPGLAGAPGGLDQQIEAKPAEHIDAGEQGQRAQIP